jgi:hypothetical protein
MESIRCLLSIALFQQLIVAPCVFAQEFSVAGLDERFGGKKIRIMAPSLSSKPYEGQFVEMNADTIVISKKTGIRAIVKDRFVKVPLGVITKIEVRTHYSNNRKKGFLYGFFPAAIGTALLATGASPDGLLSERDTILMKGTGLTILTTLIGTAVGHIMESETWKSVNLSPCGARILPQPQGGLNLSVAYNF